MKSKRPNRFCHQPFSKSALVFFYFFFIFAPTAFIEHYLHRLNIKIDLCSTGLLLLHVSRPSFGESHPVTSTDSTEFSVYSHIPRWTLSSVVRSLVVGLAFQLIPNYHLPLFFSFLTAETPPSPFVSPHRVHQIARNRLTLIRNAALDHFECGRRCCCIVWSHDCGSLSLSRFNWRSALFYSIYTDLTCSCYTSDWSTIGFTRFVVTRHRHHLPTCVQ